MKRAVLNNVILLKRMLTQGPSFWQILCNLLLILLSAKSSKLERKDTAAVIIDTDDAVITVENANHTTLINGTVTNGTFLCNNNLLWKYEKVVYEIESKYQDIFHNRTSGLTIRGSRALELNVHGDFIINKSLNLDGQNAKDKPFSKFLGAFLPNMSKCCYVGAGPGAAFTFHGGGHGGNGGGSWKDIYSVNYGKSYGNYTALLGGSTGSVIYDSDPGSGGGAIAINVKGKLTIPSGVTISANGYTVKDTSYPACSGGSAGGKIVLKAKEVSISGKIEANGGSSGISSNYSYYCGDGGGGGIIYIHGYNITLDKWNSSVVGGYGIEQGGNGHITIGANFLVGTININTSQCIFEASDFPAVLKGVIEEQNNTCKFYFGAKMRISSEVNVTVSGSRGLIIMSESDMIINSNILLQSCKVCMESHLITCLNGFISDYGPPGPGSTHSYAAHGNKTRLEHYGVLEKLYLGGSACRGKGPSGLAKAFGGGTVQLISNGILTIDGVIEADGCTNGTGGASGGTIWLVAKQILIGPNGKLSARGVDGNTCEGDGGVIYLEKESKIGEILPSQFDLSGGPKGRNGSIIESKRVTPNPTKDTKGSEKPKTELKSSKKRNQFSSTKATPLMSSKINPRALSKQFQHLSNVSVNQTNAMDVLSNVKKAFKASGHVTQADITISLGLIMSVTNKTIYNPMSIKESNKTGMLILECMDEIIKSKAEKKIALQSENVFQDVSMECVTLLERYGSLMADSINITKSVHLGYRSLELDVKIADIQNPEDITVSRRKQNSKQKAAETIFIPKDIIASSKDGRRVPVISVLMNTSQLYEKSNTVDKKQVKIVSSVLAVFIPAKVKIPLKKPLLLRYNLTEKINKNDDGEVRFWSDKSGSKGWSSDGCVTKVMDGIVSATCNHMTGFAVLVQVADYKVSRADAVALDTITYIGCGISLLGLLLTFGTFISLNGLDPERTTIHTNLVVALGLAQIIFLAGIDATHNKVGCVAVAILLHYFFAAAFSWMFAEGIHLYRKVVSVFTHGNKIRFYYFLGWGLPVFLVVISGSIRPDGYGRREVCWISMDDGLIWAFVLPIILVVVVNFAILVCVVRILMVSIATVNAEEDRRITQIRSGIKAIAILIPILGITWILGILAVNKKTIAFQYIFCIFNSFQGIFIFLLHCVGNSEVRSALQLMHKKYTLTNSLGGKSTVPKQSSGSLVVKRQVGSSDEWESASNVPNIRKGENDELPLQALHCPAISFKG